ncbi:MAG TPA: ATP-dependent DNA helicase UvrD2 [Streptosporangiaceae bacterium]
MRPPDAAAAAGPDAVLAELDPEQRQVALAARGPVCVLAGAGTGKTRAVAHRIAYAVATGVVDPARVLAVTFTTRAAGELRGRLRLLGRTAAADSGIERVQARTFHAAALRQLTHFWPAAVGGPPPRVLDSKITLVAEAARRLRVTAALAELRDVAAEIEWAKVTQVRPDDYQQASAKAGRAGPLRPATIARLYAGYEELRAERHLADFESVLELTAAIIADYQPAAAAIRARYSYFVVDEYQDVNPLQKLLLDAWLGDRDDICVVGDPRQTIYSFAGATPGYLTGFPAEFPDAAVIRLVRNYRSTPQVVMLANRLAGGDLVAQRAGGPQPEFTEYPGEQDETASLARTAAGLIQDGTPASQIAVLVRTNAQTPAIEQALAAAGVPFVVKGTERFFDRAEVRQAIALLRAAARSASATDEPAAQVRAVLSGIGLTSQPPGGRGQARERWESLQSLAQLAAGFFAAAPGGTLADLWAELAHRSAIGQAPAMDGVTVASLHAAKGLEWDAVFLPGLTDGTIPIVYAQSEEAIAEERRLLYVGVTRARQRLQLSWALTRTDGRAARTRSRFVAELTSPGRPAVSRRGRRDTAGQGGVPGAAGADDPVLARLRDWRKALAAERGVPAYVIFSDATLRRIAGRRPATAGELATIPGVGQAKLDRYGSAVLALCAEPVSRAGG